MLEESVLHGMIREIERLGGSANSELIIKDQVVRIAEPFTAGLIAIRLYPMLWSTPSQHGARKQLCNAVLTRLCDSRPSSGGGWPFFDPVSISKDELKVELIAPDADTTAVCWAGLLLAGEIRTTECSSAFKLICDNFARDGDVYFDDSGRLDIIALCNMVFFFMLYCERYEAETGLDSRTIVSSETSNGLLRARTLIIHVLSLSCDDKVAYWLRYYMGSSASALARVCGFVAPIVLRWPEHEFIEPIRAALSSACLRSQKQGAHESFLDACMLALSSVSPLDSIEREIDRVANIFSDREAIFYTVLHKMAFVSSLFTASCFLAALTQPVASYQGKNPQVMQSTLKPMLPVSLNAAALEMTISNGTETGVKPMHVLDLIRSPSSEGALKEHFNRTFSPTLDYHSLPDAVVVSETCRIILERGWSAGMGPRLKSARELLLHCLSLSKDEFEMFWGTSYIDLQLSVLLMLHRIPNSLFLAPLKDKLMATVLKDDSQPEFLRMLVNRVCLGKPAMFPSGDVCPMTRMYIRRILDPAEVMTVEVADEELEQSKFNSHLNYDVLKAVIIKQVQSQATTAHVSSSGVGGVSGTRRIRAAPSPMRV